MTAHRSKRWEMNRHKSTQRSTTYLGDKSCALFLEKIEVSNKVRQTAALIYLLKLESVFPQFPTSEALTAVSLDINKAYDSVHPSLLVEKLWRSGLDEVWIRAIHHLLRGRIFAVKIDEQISGIRAAVVGLPRRSTIAPALFKFFLHDSPQAAEGINEFKFADDELVIAYGDVDEAKEKMEDFLGDLQTFYEQNGLSCNIAKSNSIVITGTLNRYTVATREKLKEIEINMNGWTIPRKNQIKYLGVTITDKWTFIAHLTNSLAKVAGITGAMQKVLKHQKLLASETKMAFFKAAIRPILGYGFAVWSGISSHQMERLRCAERKFIRWCRDDGGRVLGSHKYINSKWIYRDAGVSRIDAWLIDLYIKQMNRFEASSNQLIAAMFHPENARRCVRRDKYPQPEALFHLNTLNPLMDAEGRTLHFNQRIRDRGTVYVTAQ